MTTNMHTDLFRTVRRRLASRNTFSVQFTKQDGTLRTMRLQYTGGPIKGTMMQVMDLDLNEIRTVNMATIHTMGEIKAKAAVVNPSAMTCEEISDLF